MISAIAFIVLDILLISTYRHLLIRMNQLAYISINTPMTVHFQLCMYTLMYIDCRYNIRIRDGTDRDFLAGCRIIRYALPDNPAFSSRMPDDPALPDIRPNPN